MLNLRTVSRFIRNRLTRAPASPIVGLPIRLRASSTRLDVENGKRASVNLATSRGVDGESPVTFFPVDEQSKHLWEGLKRAGVVKPQDRSATTLDEVVRNRTRAICLLRRDTAIERALANLEDLSFSINDLELVAYPKSKQTLVTPYRRLRLSYQGTVVPPLHYSNYAYLQHLKSRIRPGMEVLDAFAGPGTVGLSLADECGLDQITLFDLNPASVEMIRHNASVNFGPRIRCRAFVSNLFTDLPQDLKFDFIVGNPPHNFDDAMHNRHLPTLVFIQAHDPGMAIHREFFRQAGERLNPGGVICLLENGQEGCIQFEHLRSLLMEFPQFEIESPRDMVGSPFYTFTVRLKP